MAVKTNSPEIVALKQTIEQRFKRTLETRTDFAMLVLDIEKCTHNHLSENTLRRLWGRINGYNTVFTRTLDVLSNYVGYAHFQEFCQTFKKEDYRESHIIQQSESISIEQLTPGDRIRIGWLPDRICIVEFIGGRTFKAIECRNSTLQSGDTFECSVMLKNYPLFVENLVHGGEHCMRYSIGIDNGLTMLEKL